MIIDTSDSRFDFSDRKWTEEYRENLETFLDEHLLEELNMVPRAIGSWVFYLERLEQEVKDRDLFEERTDDWLAERRAAVRLQITGLTKQQEALAAERDEIEQEFFRRFTERNTSGTRTSRYTISAKQDDHYPEMQDRMEFEQYVLATGKLHLLQKRLSLTAIREELDALADQKANYLENLTEAGWEEDTCRYVLVSLAQERGEEPINEEVIENKIKVLSVTNRLKEGMFEALDQHYSIPGVGISTKLTLNQVKRG
jgi:hypothetical protein